MKKIVLIAAAGILMAACNKEGETKEVTAESVTTEEAAAPATPAPADETAAARTDAGTPVATTTPAAPAPAAAAGLNPEHGMPGHRCDIPVGAPLNSPPQKANPVVPGANFNTNPVPQVVPVQPSAAAAPGPISTPPGMNPPHGQPGHRCDIQVGAPLSSAPAQ